MRAERVGGGNGRVSTISFTATDAQGGTYSNSVTVNVPHSGWASLFRGVTAAS